MFFIACLFIEASCVRIFLRFCWKKNISRIYVVLKQTKARLEENSNIYIVDVKEKAEGNPKKQPIKNKNKFLYFFISKYLRNDAMFLCFSLKSYFAECRTFSMTSKHLKCLKS